MTEWTIGREGWLSLHARVRAATGRRDSDDLLQTALLHLLERGQAGIANTEAYLLRSARNLAVDAYRREARAVVAGGCEGEVARVACSLPMPDEVLLTREQLAQVGAALRALPPRCSAIFLTVRLDRQPYRAVAARFGVSVSTVEKEVASAMARLTLALIAPQG